MNVSYYISCIQNKRQLQLDSYVPSETNEEEKYLKAVEVHFSCAAFEEHLWISIDLCGSDCLLIGSIYRSPSSNTCDCTKSLCDLLQSIVGHSSHLLICGDFNYSDINWSDPLDPIPNTAHSQLFIDTFQDLFFTNMWTNRLDTLYLLLLIP